MGRQIVNKKRDAFAEKAMKIRMAKGMNQFEISTKLGYRSNEYARIESGFRPMRYQLIPKLCEILGVPADTFDDVIQDPNQQKYSLDEANGTKILERLEEVRQEVLGLSMGDFCRIMETSAKNYQNIRIAQNPLVKYIKKLISKNYLKDPRISYSYLIEGKIGSEVKILESLQDARQQLEKAKERILALERANKALTEKVREMEYFQTAPQYA